VKKRTIEAAPTTTSPDAPREGPFPYRDYVAAHDTLKRAMETGHFFASVAGPSGTGKSSLPRQLSAELPGSRVQIVYVSSTSASAFGLINSLARTLRVRLKRSSLETAQRCALALRSAAPLRYVLWLDEAHEASTDTLDEVRTLAEADLTTSQILSVVLSGLPELRTLLDSPGLFPLKRRLAFRCQLAGLGRDELDAFLVHRFGATAPGRFSSELRDEIFERTEAIPAILEKVARFAFARAGSGPVADTTLREAFDACL
jgi:type II secretory pathway predicted ATPase ExeA